MEESSYIARVSVNRISLWKDKSPLMGSLDMELTERCNNNCIHCCINLPANDVSTQERELRTDEIKAILKEAVSLGCLRVRFTGGEPLLREDFDELYLFARRQGLRVLLFTNATLITSRLAALLARIPPLEKVEISLYGMKRQSYEAVTRTPGSFEGAWAGLRLLLERRVPFIVKSAFLPPNKREMEAFEAWANTLPGMDRPPSYALFFDVRCRRDSEEKNRLIKRLRPSPKEGLWVLTRRREEYFRESREFCRRFATGPGLALFSCGAGVGGGCVDAYGYFQPCMMLRHPGTIHNLKSGSLKDALIHTFPKVREQKASQPAYLERCAKCFLRGLCEQCPGKSWTEHGILDSPVEYLCDVAHAQARYLGLLRTEEKAWEVSDLRERLRDFSGKSAPG